MVPPAIPWEVTAAASLIIALAFLYKRLHSSKKRSYREAPEAPRGWPVIGHLPLLGSHPNIGRVLSAIAETQGPIFTVRLGARRALAVNSRELAKECLTINDRALAGRPQLAAGKYLGYNYAMTALSPYGNFWRESRKIGTLELLSNARLEQLKHVRNEEVSIFVEEIHKQWIRNNQQPAEVEMMQWFKDLTFNVVVRLVAGKQFFGSGQLSDESRRFTKAICDLTTLQGAFVASDVWPILGRLDLGGYKHAMKKTATEVDCLLSSWLKEHREWATMTGGANKERDFMDVLLRVVDEAHVYDGYDVDTSIKGNSLAMLIGGTDTSSISLQWTLALLLNNPHVLKKAQQEIDTHVGRDRRVEESDIKHLIYLNAIIKEGFRLYPAGPVLVPHEAIDDCVIGGYNVRPGTRILINVWAIQRDPNIWSDPLEFKPERFLTTHANIDVRGQHFELLPFGSGRRACPGVAFALQIMHLTLARLIHEFDMTRVTSDLIDMSEGGGATMPKANPYGVLFTPRLSVKLFE